MSEKILTYSGAPLVHEGNMISYEEGITHTGTFLQKWIDPSLMGFNYCATGHSILVDKTDNDNVYVGGSLGGMYDSQPIGAIVKFNNEGIKDASFSRVLGGTEYVWKMCLDYSTNSIVCASNIRPNVVYKLNKTTGDNTVGFLQSAYRTTILS